MTRPLAPTMGESRTHIAATSADVRDGHAGFDAKQTYDLDRFTGSVALFFIMPDWADDISDGTVGFRKSSSRRAGCRHEVLGRAYV